jgi:Niemann-Pick C1 protein
MWVPQNSKLLHDTNRFLNSFDEMVRQQTVIIEADNVLAPSVLAKVALITNAFMNFTVTSGNRTVGWDDVCFKVPIIVGFVDVQNLLGQDSESSEEEDEATSEEDDSIGDSLELTDLPTEAATTSRSTFVPSVHLPSDYFCGILKTLRQGCLQENLMELFEYNETKLAEMTLEDVLAVLNTTKTSPVTGHEVDYAQQLSGIVRNATGHIVAAKALMIRLMVPVKVNEVRSEELKNAFGEEWVTPEILAWEEEFNRQMADLKMLLDDEETKIYYSAASSQSDARVFIQSSEVNKELLGFLLMFVYMQLVLSRVSWVEARVSFVSGFPVKNFDFLISRVECSKSARS